MNNFYLFTSGTLKRQDSSLIYITDDRTILIPVHQVDMICCFGEVTLNKRVLEFVSRHKISLLFFNFYGDLCGAYHPIKRRSGQILMEQAQKYQNPETRLIISQAIQTAAFRNMLSVLKYYRKDGYPLQKQVNKLEEGLREIAACASVEELLLIEALNKKEYYSAFDIILENTDFIFETRKVRGPANEVNSMMSFGYYLLYSTILCELDQSRLTPEIAFIHSDIASGAVLQYDLADIYKPILIDRLIFRLIRRHQITRESFEERENGIFLTEGGKKIYVSEYQKELAKTRHFGVRALSNRSVIRKDINALANYIQGATSEVTFTVFSW